AERGLPGQVVPRAGDGPAAARRRLRRVPRRAQRLRPGRVVGLAPVLAAVGPPGGPVVRPGRRPLRLPVTPAATAHGAPAVDTVRRPATTVPPPRPAAAARLEGPRSPRAVWSPGSAPRRDG